MWWTESMRLRVMIPGLAAATALAACASTGNKPEKTAVTPTQQYSIEVREAADQVGFSIHPGGLSLKQRAALVAFADRWREAPQAGDIVVQAPAGGDEAAGRERDEIATALRAVGIPGERIRSGDYQGAAGAPVLASFTRLEAHGPDCRAGWDDLSATGANRASTHFGCAEVANLAAQIADPRDLLAPAPTTAADAGRRDTVIGKYRTGQITSSLKDEQATGVVSKAVTP